MIGSLLQPELVELIRQRNFNQLREILCGFPAPDIAEIFTDLSADDEAVLMRILPHDLAADVFEYLSVEDQEKLVQALGNEQVAQILNEMPPDDRTALLEELPSAAPCDHRRSEEHTSELQSQSNLVCRLLLEKKKKKIKTRYS